METIKNFVLGFGKHAFNSLFERSIRVYIQKHLGEFLVGKLTTDQVDLGLDGGSLASLYLNAEAINERLEGVNVPFTLVSGYVDILHLHIPWADISTESISVTVDGMELVIKFKEDETEDGLDVKSMFESMTASMVEEVIKSNTADADIRKISEAGKGASPFESVELMSEFIKSITSRIQVTMQKVIIKTEKSPGVSVEVNIDNLEYYDKDCTSSKDKKPNLPQTPKGYSTKVLEISKVTVHLEEMWNRASSPKPMDPIQQSTMAFDIAMSSPPNSGNYMMQSSSMTQSIYPGMTTLDMTEPEEPESGGKIPIISMDKSQTVLIQIKNEDQLPGPNVDVKWNLESLHVFMSPKLLTMVTKFLGTEGGNGSKKGPKQVPMTMEDYELCRRKEMEEERQRKDNGLLEAIDVPPLTMDKHMEMMQGATADSLLSDDDMFFSAYPSAYKSSLSGFDVSDSASVSTFGDHSTHSTTNASAFSHARRTRVSTERSFSTRSWEDHTVESQRVNVTVPFFTVTLLLEDPKPCAVIPGLSSTPPTTSTSTLSCPPSSSFPPKSSSIHDESFGPSSLPMSFINSTPQFLHPVNRTVPSLSSFPQHTQWSFKTDNKKEDSESDDEEEEFHDSGDYFETPHTSSVDALEQEKPNSRSANVPAATKPVQTQHWKEGSPSKSRPTESLPSSKDAVSSRLQEVATKFFEAIARLETRAPLHKLRDRVAEILTLDHLGLIAKPVHVDVAIEKKAMETKHSVKVTFGKLEVIECLFDCFSSTSDFAKTALPKLPQYSEKGSDSQQRGKVEISQLLTFHVNSSSDSQQQFDPKVVFNVDKPQLFQSALILTFDSVQKKRRHKEAPLVRLSFDFNKLTSEVDVTIIDRLAHLINRESGVGSGTNIPTQLVDDYGHIDEAIKDEQGGGKIQPEIRIKAIHATLKVRFPIPDLRVDPPAQTRDWWRRNLHKEILELNLEAPEANSTIRPDEPWQLELQVFKISAYLQEDINKDPILFGEITVEDPKATPHDAQHFNWPRLVVCVSHKSNSALEAEEESDTSAHSMDQYLDSSLYKKESGPFSKKKSMYERDDLSCSEQHAPANDEMVMPGDVTEMRQFREECINRTCLSVDITVPKVTAFMHSREFLELIYNRFNNDLLMWEPQQPQTHPYMSSMMPSNTNLQVLHMLPHQMGDFSQSGECDQSDSDDDDEEESMHYSIHDRHSSKADKPSHPKLLNKMCFSLTIGNGRLLAVIPHAEPESNPGAHGEIMLTIKDGLLFSVNQHNGDPELKYLCLQVNKAHMYHNSCVVTQVEPGTLDHIRDKVPQYLKSKIYRSDRCATDKSQGLAGYGGDSPDMLTLVVKTKIDTLDNVKNFTVAVRVDGATLRHEMHRSGESWITQAIDLLDLKDFPILGYTMPKIMTELHLQVDHCSIDYRPLNLPVWSFLTVEHFSVCTNIIAEAELSQIRLLLEDSALFLSKKCNKEVNLFKDYVCVAEMDQFKIWLQFCYNKSGKQKCPKSDLRFMVNELNLRTCADSTHALLELIQYIVSDGDLVEKFDEEDITPTGTEDGAQFFPGSGSGDRLIPSPSLPVAAITPEQEASVVSALEEAMADCQEPHTDATQLGAKKGKGQVTRVFFQVDSPEPVSFQRTDLDNALHITVSDSSDSSSPDEEGAEGRDTNYEEFEIIDCHYKEVRNIKGTHEVYMLTENPVEVVESFIPKPTSSYDHLKAPDKFPDPEYQYTLREMSMVWQIFGGSDFSQPRRGSSSERGGLAKGLQSPRDQRRWSSDSAGKSGRHTWRRRGGDWRDFDVIMELDLNKIRFRYEVYPTITKQSSRFKLLVNSVELRDRIKLSEINKFLVKLVDKEHPEQSSAYMLMFSGVFTRPEHLPFREECEVKAFCLPIKLNIDQVSLNFLRKFILEVADPEPEFPAGAEASGGRSSPLGGRASPSGGRSSPRTSVSSTDPIMRVGEPSTKESSMDQTELLMKFDEFSNQQSMYLQSRLNELDNLEVPQEDLPVFIKSFVLISDITIKMDYRGKQLDMDSGMMGVMLGLASLTGSIIKLKRLNCQKGILGWNKLVMYAANEWLNDIKVNQIHNILKGVGGLSILCQIFQGLTDLIRLPIQQYQKDRRIMRGLQRGANSFTLNTIMAILDLTNKVVGSIQYCAELGYDMMSPGPSVRRRKQLRHRNRQPRNTAEGAKAALQLMTEGVKESASNLSAIVSEESAHKGYVGVVGGTLRNATPEFLVKPVALLAEAGTNLVQGLRNEVDPSRMKEEEDRWKQA